METIDFSQVEALGQKLEKYGEGSGQVIQKYYNEQGFERIASHIPGLIHASGRKPWKKKAASATSAAYTSVFDKTIAGLSMTVKTKSRYNYLYFPDDGSNTQRHVGNQQFMLRGAEAVSDQMVNEMVERLVAAFEEA